MSCSSSRMHPSTSETRSLYNRKAVPFCHLAGIPPSGTTTRNLTTRRSVVGCCVVLCPLYLRATGKLLPSARAIVVPELEQDLRDQGDHETDQCIDTTDGCLRALVDLNRLQVTGTMYGEFLFREEPPEPLLKRRAEFLHNLDNVRPSRIVVMTGVFPESLNGYEQLNHWHSFRQWLTGCYTLIKEPKFNTPHDGEVGYEIFLLNSANCGKEPSIGNSP